MVVLDHGNVKVCRGLSCSVKSLFRQGKAA